MTAVRTLGAAVLISILMMMASIIAGDHSAADEPFVDGPLGPAVIQPPDPSKPIDVNGGS
jgi:hypothetical protein